MKSGAQLIAEERLRVLQVEGFDARHDDDHDEGQLVGAAIAYIERYMADAAGQPHSPWQWPFEEEWWKPSDDPVRNLVKAGEFIAAEIDRLQRIK